MLNENEQVFRLRGFCSQPYSLSLHYTTIALGCSQLLFYAFFPSVKLSLVIRNKRGKNNNRRPNVFVIAFLSLTDRFLWVPVNCLLVPDRTTVTDKLLQSLFGSIATLKIYFFIGVLFSKQIFMVSSLKIKWNNFRTRLSYCWQTMSGPGSQFNPLGSAKYC